MSASGRFGDYTLRPPLVGFQGIAAYATEAGLVALAVVLPALAHALGVDGHLMVPVQWTVILAAVLKLISIPIIAAPIARGLARESK
jgi:hypothetical protein